MKFIQTAERSSELDSSDNIMLHRHLIAYQQASDMINGYVLEIGSGEGYGLRILAPHSNKYVAVDKYKTTIDTQLINSENIEFHQLKVPPLQCFADNSFDYIVTFQVIEHIKKDIFFIKEIYRILKPNGKLILTTPNIEMSLTRNPWHIREYTYEQLMILIKHAFQKITIKGVYGNEKIMEYYNDNKKSVQRITRFDMLNLQYRLPRLLLKIPYDIMNRMNRKKLLKQNKALMQNVTTSDFFLKETTNNCFDFFCIANK